MGKPCDQKRYCRKLMTESGVTGSGMAGSRMVSSQLRWGTLCEAPMFISSLEVMSKSPCDFVFLTASSVSPSGYKGKMHLPSRLHSEPV